MNKTYLVVFEKAAEDNWGAFTPDIGGAVGAGDSFEAARTSVLEGIAIQLEDLAERGLPAPLPVTSAVNFAEFDPDHTDLQYVVEWLSVELPVVSVHSHEESKAA